jgi:hypothetical protein
MAKAEIVTGTGTKVYVEGSVDEIAAIISLYNKNEPKVESPPSIKEKPKEKSKKNQLKPASTLVEYILELRDTGFFDTPKKTILVKGRLDQDGHFYPMQSVSTCLINRNEKRELGRVKEGKKWAYVKR